MRVYLLWLDAESSGLENTLYVSTCWLLYANAPIEAFALAEAHMRAWAETEDLHYNRLSWRVSIAPPIEGDPRVIPWFIDKGDDVMKNIKP